MAICTSYTSRLSIRHDVSWSEGTYPFGKLSERKKYENVQVSISCVEKFPWCSLRTGIYPNTFFDGIEHKI